MVPFTENLKRKRKCIQNTARKDRRSPKLVFYLFFKKRFLCFLLKKTPKNIKKQGQNEAQEVPTNLSHGPQLAQNAPKPHIFATSPQK